MHSTPRTLTFRNPESKVLAYSRWNGEGSQVVVGEFSDNFLGGYHVPNFPAPGMWHEGRNMMSKLR